MEAGFISVIAILLGGSFYMFIGKKRISKKKREQDIRLHETSKMLKNIMLNNEGKNVDRTISILNSNNVHIDFDLR